MKVGRSLTALAAEIERQATVKRDFVADTRSVTMRPSIEGGKSKVSLVLEDVGEFGVNDIAHEQIGARLGIPRAYYDRMREAAPVLLAGNVNHWFRQQSERRMVRTMDGNARAFLSDRFRPLDYIDMANSVLPIFADAGVNVESCELTDRRLYLKAVSPARDGGSQAG